MTMIGDDVKNRVVIVIDEIADTCENIYHVARKLLNSGASKIYAIVIHGIFSGEALDQINNTANNFENIVVTNTIPQDKHEKNCQKIQCIDVSMIFAESVIRNQLPSRM